MLTVMIRPYAVPLSQSARLADAKPFGLMEVAH
jgi:hypothetical protein